LAHEACNDAHARTICSAQSAVRVTYGDGDILTTLGVAQYRTDQYAEAKATLTESEKRNATKIRRASR
jgi:hypothetical protein